MSRSVIDNGNYVGGGGGGGKVIAVSAFLATLLQHTILV